MSKPFYLSIATPDNSDRANLNCNCMFQIGGQCKESLMSAFKEQLIKDGNEALIRKCPLHSERECVNIY